MTATGPNPAPQNASQEMARIECELARLRAVRLSQAAGAVTWMRVLTVLLSLALILAAFGGMWLLQAQESGRLRPATPPQPATERR